MKKTILTLCVSLVAAVAWTQTQPAPAAKTDADPVIITAGDIQIRRSEFEGALKTLPAEYQQYALGPGKKQFAEDFLRMKMLAQKGMSDGLDKDPDVISQMNLLRENLVAQAELKKIDSTIKISDDDLKKMYDSKQNEYEQVKARHILIAFKGSPAAQPGKKELTEEEAKAKAEEIHKKVVGGADFAELAKAESDDTSSGRNGGDLGSFGKGQMVPEFEEAAFKAKPGEITPVVRTQFGYHVIKVDEHSVTPFESVKESLEKSEHQKKLQELLDAMKTVAKPTFNEAYFAPPPPPAAAPAETKKETAKPAETKTPAKKPAKKG